MLDAAAEILTDAPALLVVEGAGRKWLISAVPANGTYAAWAPLPTATNCTVYRATAAYYHYLRKPLDAGFALCPAGWEHAAAAEYGYGWPRVGALIGIALFGEGWWFDGWGLAADPPPDEVVDHGNGTRTAYWHFKYRCFGYAVNGSPLCPPWAYVLGTARSVSYVADVSPGAEWAAANAEVKVEGAMDPRLAAWAPSAPGEWAAWCRFNATGLDPVDRVVDMADCGRHHVPRRGALRIEVYPKPVYVEVNGTRVEVPAWHTANVTVSLTYRPEPAPILANADPPPWGAVAALAAFLGLLPPPIGGQPGLALTPTVAWGLALARWAAGLVAYTTAVFGGAAGLAAAVAVGPRLLPLPTSVLTAMWLRTRVAALARAVRKAVPAGQQPATRQASEEAAGPVQRAAYRHSWVGQAARAGLRAVEYWEWDPARLALRAAAAGMHAARARSLRAYLEYWARGGSAAEHAAAGLMWLDPTYVATRAAAEAYRRLWGRVAGLYGPELAGAWLRTGRTWVPTPEEAAALAHRRGIPVAWSHDAVEAAKRAGVPLAEWLERHPNAHITIRGGMTPEEVIVAVYHRLRRGGGLAEGEARLAVEAALRADPAEALGMASREAAASLAAWLAGRGPHNAVPLMRLPDAARALAQADGGGDPTGTRLLAAYLEAAGHPELARFLTAREDAADVAARVAERYGPEELAHLLGVFLSPAARGAFVRVVRDGDAYGVQIVTERGVEEVYGRAAALHAYAAVKTGGSAPLAGLGEATGTGRWWWLPYHAWYQQRRLGNAAGKGDGHGEGEDEG